MIPTKRILLWMIVDTTAQEQNVTYPRDANPLPQPATKNLLYGNGRPGRK